MVVDVSAMAEIYASQVLAASKADKEKTFDQLMDEMVPGILQAKVRAFFGDAVESDADKASAQQ
ncbi:hypothetical protein [Lacticaseibacillus absianus]|uniref:hypothetical protein n=1 Tax=Lacticaseibacillus absianus TaxID=2729623 RepID=UPI0015CEC839|nr:hypothetical protein [Lacticaseibacillus absianus]